MAAKPIRTSRLTNNDPVKNGRSDPTHTETAPADRPLMPAWKSAVRFPGILGSVAFALYLAWNIRWLTAGMIPPSILLGVFGIPAPTTGMIRSTMAFLHGDWNSAFLWNPFTLPFYFVLAWTALEISLRFLRKQRLVISKPLTITWPAMLLAAWIAKFAIGPQWW
jgi:hypothetical protein